MEDKIFESSRNVTIKLHHRVGKYVKLRLHFSDRWIMISEVTFDSGKRTEFVIFVRTVVCQSTWKYWDSRVPLAKNETRETRDPRRMIYRAIFIETFLVSRSEVSSYKTYNACNTYVHMCMYIDIHRVSKSSNFINVLWDNIIDKNKIEILRNNCDTNVVFKTKTKYLKI